MEQLSQPTTTAPSNLQPQPQKDPFTHFFSLPLQDSQFRSNINDLMKGILQMVDKKYVSCFSATDTRKLHLTFGMLTLKSEEDQIKISKILKDSEAEIKAFLQGAPLTLTFDKLGAFYTEYNNSPLPSVIFLDIKKDETIKKIDQKLPISWLQRC